MDRDLTAAAERVPRDTSAVDWRLSQNLFEGS